MSTNLDELMKLSNASEGAPQMSTTEKNMIVGRACACIAEVKLLSSGNEKSIQEGKALVKSSVERNDGYGLFLQGVFGIKKDDSKAIESICKKCEEYGFSDALLMMQPVGAKDELKPENKGKWESLILRIRFNTLLNPMLDLSGLELTGNTIHNELWIVVDN